MNDCIGELIEFRVTRKLLADLVKWIADEAQFPAVTAGDFTTSGIPAVLANRRETATFAVARLIEILRHHGVKAVDADVDAVLERFRPRCAAIELEGSAR